jgi:hypothetical protein
MIPVLVASGDIPERWAQAAVASVARVLLSFTCEAFDHVRRIAGGFSCSSRCDVIGRCAESMGSAASTADDPAYRAGFALPSHARPTHFV